MIRSLSEHSESVIDVEVSRTITRPVNFFGPCVQFLTHLILGKILVHISTVAPRSTVDSLIPL